MEADPQSGQDWNGPYTIMRWGSEDQTRLSVHFRRGRLHFDRVDEHSAAGHLSWGGLDETSGEVFALEGTFEVDRCHSPFGDD